MFELLVEKMTCGGCAARVRRAIESVDSDATVSIDLRGKKVLVETDADPAEVTAAITAAGYPARTPQPAG
ncbi:MAG TPA: heavy-metal-associated domain-containing protein [Noviherbaspirillum sp.]|uniref:heavy-metal-associated domain-containing protein n=1 Tax=Noviherbaspirillum sp. TaxID=1926288 RepID=UPI002D43AAD5|nr:heavy-metal-associated domain-containing protein [Noviherbaspirillum sp.]HYD95988.1 heavy-metal-associated domain-containing protein [Noviherbaspirillum sp.]